MAQGHQALTGKKARKGFAYSKNGNAKKNNKRQAAATNKKGGK